MNGIIKNNLKILKKNFPFLLSGIMLVILFSQPSKFMLLISLAITGTIFIVSFCKSNISLVGKQKKTCTKFYYILSLIIVALGFYSFYKSWGNKFIDNLARDIKIAYPNSTGYSVRNLKYMAKFAAEYPDEQIVQEVLAQITWYHMV